MGEWMSWTFSFGDKAYKGIRPLEMEIKPELKNAVTGFWSLFHSDYQPTGRYYIKFKYDMGPFSTPREDRIMFGTYGVAKSWYDFVYNGVFLGNRTSTAPVPPTSGPNNPNKNTKLKLV